MVTERWSMYRPPEWFQEPGTGRWKKIWTTLEGDIRSEYSTPPPGAVWKDGGVFAIVPPTMEQAQQALATLPTEQWQGFYGEFFHPLETPVEVPLEAAPTYEEAITALSDVSISSEEWLRVYGEVYRRGEAPDIQSILTTLFPGRVTGDIEADLRALEQYINNAPDAFYEDMTALGRTAESEALMRGVFPGITDAELTEIFGEELLEFREEKKRWDKMVADWKWGFTKLYGGGEGLKGKAADSFIAGVGDMLTSVGGAASWLGYDDIGGVLSATGSDLQRTVPPTIGKEFEVADLLDPEFYATKIVRALPFALSIAPVAIGGFYGIGAIAGAAGLGTIGAWIVAAIGSGVLSRSVESVMEAGGSYGDAIARGKTEAEAREEANEVFRNNMLLAGADAWEIAIALAPTPKWVPASLIKSGLARTIRIAGKMIIVGLSEGGEEVYQDMVQRHARGEEWQLDAVSKEVFAIGMVMGLGMGLGGDVLTGFVGRAKGGMTPSVKKDFDDALSGFEEQGIPTDQAELMALDVVAQTPEGQQVIKDAIEETRKLEPVIPEKPFEELTPEQIGKLAAIRAEREAAIPVPKAVPGVRPEVTLPRGWTEKVGKTKVTEVGEPIEASLDYKSKVVTFRDEASMADPLIRNHEIAHIMEFNMTSAANDALVKDYSNTAKAEGIITDEHIRMGLSREMLIINLGEVLTNPATVNPKIVEVFQKYFPEIKPTVIPKPPAVEKPVTPLSLDEAAELITKADKLIAEGKRAEADALFVEVTERGIEGVSPERVIYSEGGIPINPDEVIPPLVADKIPIVQDIGAKERVRPSRKVFEKMGLYEEYKGIQRAEVLQGEARQEFAKKLKEVNKWVDRKRRFVVFRELENPGSQTGLTFNEKRAVAWFKKFFDEWADVLNLPQNKRIKNYITHIFEADIAAQLKLKHPLDVAIVRALEYRTPKTIFNPFLQERLGATVGLIEDPFSAASAYESRQLRVLYYEPLLQKIAAIANDEATPQAARTYLLDYSQRMTGKPSKLDLEINNTLREIGEKIAKLPGGAPFARFLTRGNPSGMASYQFTSALYTLWLGFKATSAIRNLSQHTLIIGEVGPVHFANGIRLRFTEEGKAALDESLVWRSRRAAFLPGIDDSFASRWTDKFRESALYMFRLADAQNVKDAFLAGYSEAKSLLPEADRQVWIDRGDEVAADTQYLYTKMNSMAMSQTSLGRVFSVLTTWSVNWMELMTKWVSRRPSSVYLEYEKATGTKVTVANWSTSYKAILMYIVIVSLGYLIKEETRLKAWEYTGITSIRYLANVIGGDFPGLQVPGAVASMVAGFITDDDRMFKQGWYEFRSSLTPGIVRQIENVASGERDWLTLFFYLEGKDWKIKKLKNNWEKGWKEYEGLASKDRDEYRKANPLIEAQMFVTGKFTTLSSDEARAEVLRLIEKHDLDTEMIDGYEKVFGVDTDKELTDKQKLLGTVELTETGEQKVKANGELDYFSTSNFASEVNKLLKVVGRFRIENDGNALAIEFLRAQDLWTAYEDLTDEKARVLFRQQFPDIEAQLYLWGKISTFKNPKSAEILLRLMDKYGILPEAIPAFLSNPEKYDELFTPIYELKSKWFDKSVEYEALETDEERAQFKADNLKWIEGMKRIEAIEKEIVAEDTYVDWYTNPDIKRPKDYKGDWYEDDWYLQEHDDFYQEMLDKGIWKPRNFDKVPTREVFELYKTWQLKDLGNARRDMEARYPELDLWLHLKFGTMLESER